jgi:hypothetical protein
MNWHYAAGTEQRGPFSEEKIRELIAAGNIAADTLVWRKGMADWRPARDTELFGAPPPASESTAPARHRCIITGKLYPAAQIIQTPDGPVSHEGKDLYYQSRREGAPLPMAEGLSNARTDGKYVVVPVEGARLPLRCVKTNAPVTAAEAKPKTLYWYPPLLAITILLNLLIFLILYLIFRKRVQLDIPLSAAGRSQLRKHAAIAWLEILIAVACFITGLVEPSLAWLIAPAFVLFITGMLYGNYKATKLRVAKLRQGEVWLAGTCPEFRASLPPYT